MMEDFVKQFGFASEKEFHHLVATVDISTIDKHTEFLVWKNSDGTKEGLEKLRAKIGTITLPSFR